jgi:tetratricopeptide (TPR) repeat protein
VDNEQLSHRLSHYMPPVIATHLACIIAPRSASARLSHGLAPALLIAAAIGAGSIAAQTPQYVSSAGVTYRSLPDTGAVGRAAAAFRASPTAANAITLGAAQSAIRQYREAIQTYSSALARFPGNAELLRWRGHRYLTLRDFTRAAIDLETAIGIDSALYGAWYHLGIVRFANGQFEEAARAFRTALPLAPDPGERAGSTDWLWMALSRAGRTAEARRLLEARPDSIPANNAYARRLSLYRGEIGPDAVLGPADTADVQRSTLAFGVGHWQYLRGDLIGAELWYRKAIEAGGWPGFGFIISETELSGRTRLNDDLRRERLAAGCVVPPGSLTRREIRVAIEWPELPQDTGAVREARRQVGLLVAEAGRRVSYRVQPGTLELPQGDAHASWRELQGSMTLTLRRDSTFSAELPTLSPFDPSRSQAVLSMLHGILDSLRSAKVSRPALPEAFAADSIVAELRIEVEGEVPPMPAALQRLRPVARIPLFTLAVPVVQHAALTPDSPPPRYPTQLGPGFRIGVIAWLAVDTSGRVIAHSFRESWSPRLSRFRAAQARVYDQFVQSVVEGLSAMRFTPATVGGCPIRAATQQVFLISDGPSR